MIRMTVTKNSVRNFGKKIEIYQGVNQEGNCRKEKQPLKEGQKRRIHKILT